MTPLSFKFSYEDEDTDINVPLRSVVDYCPLSRLMHRANRTAIGTAYWNSGSVQDRHLPASRYFEEIQSKVHQAFAKMLNAKELARVLNANVHPKLFSSWLVMSPNATLLAYSGKPDIQQLRDRAALLSQVWKEHKDKLKAQDHTATSTDAYSSSASTIASTVVEGALETLTIENANSNIIIRAVQPRLLLVLVGGPPPRRPADFFKITSEARGDARYPEESAKSNSESGSIGSGAQDSGHTSPPEELLEHAHEEAVIDEVTPKKFEDLSDRERTKMLSIQRKKIDAATDFMRGDFTSRNFIMPDEGSIP